MWSKDITDELHNAMKKYKEKFDDIVPLMIIPNMREEELVAKIEKAISEGKTIDNYIPEMKIFEQEGILS